MVTTIAPVSLRVRNKARAPLQFIQSPIGREVGKM
jgi:hypothetical protein